MVESFQDYSWIHDFEADFPKKVSIKMLNLVDFDSFNTENKSTKPDYLSWGSQQVNKSLF